MRRFFHFVHGLSHGCGKVPLLAALALVTVARFGSLGPPPVSPERALAAPARALLPKDFELIDRVLARRAPDLGLILRHQVGVAIAEEAERAGYDPLLILAIIDVESDFDEGALSSRGARGLMQITPNTLFFLAQREGVRLSLDEVASDPALQVRLGIRYLRYLNDRFSDLDQALMAYNAGPAKLRRARQAGTTELFARYPRAVRRDFRRFREGVGLGGDWTLALREVPEDGPGADSFASMGASR
jgi:soluble lytic murein transglycosylase